jgi:uncharacterized protein
MSSLTAEQKLNKLKKIIGGYSEAALAFSGGVDSSLLAAVGRQVLGDKFMLLHAVSAVHPSFERDLARQTAAFINLPLLEHKLDILNVPGFAANPAERCYLCKKALFTGFKNLAQQKGCRVLFDGGNTDDAADYRPGRRALTELGIISPLALAGMDKGDIRYLARKLKLPAADEPSNACLASRFPYGDRITAVKLGAVEKIEDAVRDLGFKGFRARCHGRLIRYEFAPPDMALAFKVRDKLTDLARRNGFTYAALDLRGYRTGALNEALELSPVVRPMEPEDAGAVFALVEKGFNRFVSAGFKPEGIDEFFKAARRFIYNRPANQLILLAERKGRLAGMINVRDYNHIGLFFVDPACLRQGVGRALMEAAEKLCLKNRSGLTEIEVNSSVYAVPVYQKLGFQIRKPERELNGMRFVDMVKLL